MAEQFKEQGGAATMDPSPIRRWLQSKLLTKIISHKHLQKQRDRHEKRRIKSATQPTVEYFHQVDDPYSYLAAQCLVELAQRYDIKLVCHLVTVTSGKNIPEPDLLGKLSRHDACSIASHYGLSFAHASQQPDAQLAEQATAILVSLALDKAQSFVEHVAVVTEALWSSDQQSLNALSQELGMASSDQVKHAIKQGNMRRQQLGHYSSAMFYCDKEWYWGVDRLYHLEKRLAALGIDREVGRPPLVPRPQIINGPLKDHARLTLEFYVSLRSPYTAIIFDRVVALAASTGVQLALRPVLPMVMRGVPATRAKGIYIFMDAAREAREAGVDFGHFYDPIGDPTRRCYSLYQWACDQGKGVELIGNFLNCAFVKGVNTNNNRGLKKVVEDAGLDWQEAKKLVGQPGWEDALESNRQVMYSAGLWGVPSFRLLDETGQQILVTWGQDRLWLIAKEIQRQLTLRN